MAEAVRRGVQAMVFVHSRKETAKTARCLLEIAQRAGDAELFAPQQHPQVCVTVPLQRCVTVPLQRCVTRRFGAWGFRC